jgi:hypothetical protein
MKLKDLCVLDVASCTPQLTIEEAARLMRQYHTGDLVVIDNADEEPEPVGIITDRDIVLEVLAKGRDPHKTTVREIMSTQLGLRRSLAANGYARRAPSAGARRQALRGGHRHPGRHVACPRRTGKSLAGHRGQRAGARATHEALATSAVEQSCSDRASIVRRLNRRWRSRSC